MTIEEIVLIEMDVNASSSKKEQAKILANNPKFKRAIAKCVAKFYE